MPCPGYGSRKHKFGPKGKKKAEQLLMSTAKKCREMEAATAQKCRQMLEAAAKRSGGLS